MTDRVAVTLTSTLQLLRWTVGATDPSFNPATETLHALIRPVVIAAGTVKRHYKVVGGIAVIMTPAEQAVVDAATAAAEQAAATGAVRIDRVVSNPGQLPIPPPRAGLLVGVANTGGGVPGLAMSTGTGWAIFASSSTIP